MLWQLAKLSDSENQKRAPDGSLLALQPLRFLDDDSQSILKPVEAAWLKLQHELHADLFSLNLPNFTDNFEHGNCESDSGQR